MDTIKFNIPKDQPAIIKVIGIGGGGGNAVNNMHNQGIIGVSFVICNTDLQALDASPVGDQVQLGPNLTKGRGAGANPEKGKQATHESIEEIRKAIGEDTQMLFITAGMGGGTGTGGAPIVAKLAREMGVLTVGIVTTPFNFEGGARETNATSGIDEMRQYVDTLIVISNDKVLEMYADAPITEAFKNADNVLVTAAKSIAEIITVTGLVNVDFADVEAVMRDSGVAIMGSSTTTGEDRAKRGVMEALSSPLLNDNKITGAENVLINVRFGDKVALGKELEDISSYVVEEAGSNPNVILGVCHDETLTEELSITVVATGFNQTQAMGIPGVKQKKKEIDLDDENDNFVEDTKEPVIDTAQKKSPLSDETVFFRPSTVDVPLEVKEVSLYDKKEDVLKSQVEPEMIPVQQPKAVEPSKTIEPEIEIIPQKQEFIPEPEIQFTDDTSTSDSDEISKEEDLKFREYLRRRKERLTKLSDHNYHSANINELEKEPAFKRREDMQLKKKNINDKGQTISNITLEIEGEDGDVKLNSKDRNKFLHDNPD